MEGGGDNPEHFDLTEEDGRRTPPVISSPEHKRVRIVGKGGVRDTAPPRSTMPVFRKTRKKKTKK
eukprot:9801414-Karenia_brevis.AAC.1